MAIPILLRPQHQLGDFLFQSDMDKLQHNFPGEMCGGNINMNMMRTNFFAGENFYYSSPKPSASSPFTGKIMNENYANKAQSSNEIWDNAKKSFALEEATDISEKKESRKKYAGARKKKYGKKKPGPIAEDVEMTEVCVEDRVKEISLQGEIAKEQEYQDMMNMLYNNPEYFEQYQTGLQYQPALHPAAECEVVIDPSVMLHHHNPPMYFIIPHDLQLHHDQPQQAVYQPQQYVNMQQQPLHYSYENEFHLHHSEPLKTSTPTAMFLSDSSSDYFSDSNPGSECPSDDETSSVASRSSLIKSLRPSSASPAASDPRWTSSGEFSFYGTEFTSPTDDQNSSLETLELDEELNKLVLSIITE